jgi:hypothetical protein
VCGSLAWIGAGKQWWCYLLLVVLVGEGGGEGLSSDVVVSSIFNPITSLRANEILSSNARVSKNN